MLRPVKERVDNNMETEIITITGIFDFFKEDTNTVKKGELKFKSDFVLKFRITDFTINAVVRASMKDKSYSVSLTLDGSGGIKDAYCDCPRGKWICSHMAAVSLYANKKGLSKTDLPNSWIARPKKAAKQNVKTLSNLFPQSKPEYRATARKVEARDKEMLFESLKKSTPCPLLWIVGPEPPATSTLDTCVSEPRTVESILDVFKKDQQQFMERCHVTSDQIKWLAEQTKEQQKSLLWGKHRQLRLTGSNFGVIVAAYDRPHHYLNR